MKQTTAYTLLLLCFLSTASFAQTQVKMYRTQDGKRYTEVQKDSIRDQGFPVATGKGPTVGDTTFYDLEVLPKENDFVRKYKDQPLPSFSLKTLDGKVINNESLKGKVVLISFWSTTCPRCIEEMPELNQLKAAYKDVVFLAPAPEDASKVKKLLAKHPLEFVILPDAEKLFDAWGIDGYPKKFFVDKQGIIRVIKEGTPIVNEKYENGKVQLAVKETYSPILTALEGIN
jgi:peroxiredoxin